jgi:uncharacterized membrane protein
MFSPARKFRTGIGRDRFASQPQKKRKVYFMSQSATLHLRHPNKRQGRSAPAQRWGVLLGGSALAIYGLTRRSPLGYALAAGGGALAYAGASAARTQRVPRTNVSVTINASPDEVYRFWKDYENLPRFMRHLESVTVESGRRTHWKAIGPMGTRVEWTAETVDDRPGELISWRSLPDSDIEVEGTVSFREAPAGRGTVVTANIIYGSSKAQAGHILSKLVGKSPRFMMEQDLRRLKALLETGEIPTIEGQSHGPRDTMTAIARVVNPDQPLGRDASIREIVTAQRRAS